VVVWTRLQDSWTIRASPRNHSLGLDYTLVVVWTRALFQSLVLRNSWIIGNSPRNLCPGLDYMLVADKTGRQDRLLGTLASLKILLHPIYYPHLTPQLTTDWHNTTSPRPAEFTYGGLMTKILPSLLPSCSKTSTFSLHWAGALEYQDCSLFSYCVNANRHSPQNLWVWF